MINVNIIGYKQFQDSLKKMPATLRKEVAFRVQQSGERFRDLAIKELSSGMLDHPTGFLAGSITKIPVGQSSELNCSVVAGKEYAPYVEWGTITKVSVPPELSAYAAQFKGQGLKKNGGMAPRPFFFKQAPIVQKELIRHIENIIKNL